MYVFDECRLDPSRHELWRDGATVHVEKQVFDALNYLLDHRDRVVPKSELLDAVWGDRFVSDSALTSRLKDARRAIGDDGTAQRLIATVHGIGYRFVGDVIQPHAKPSRSAIRATPSRSQRIQYCRSAAGVRIAYACTGSGPSLVKAANWLTNLDLEREIPIWAHWIDALSDHHTWCATTSAGVGSRTGMSASPARCLGRGS